MPSDSNMVSCPRENVTLESGSKEELIELLKDTLGCCLLLQIVTQAEENEKKLPDKHPKKRFWRRFGEHFGGIQLNLS